LSGFETLKVCTEYNYKGEKIAHFPYNIEPENVTPVYQDFKGWKQDLTGMTTYDEPIELKEYIEFIERELKFNQNSLSWSRQKTNHLKIIQ
jgi:adenylosuccinate synthase